MARPAYPAATPLGQCRIALADCFGRVPPVWEVASAVGVPPSTWGRLEKLGAPLPSGRTLAQITRGLRRLGLPVTPVHLLGYEPIPPWVAPTPGAPAEPPMPEPPTVEPGRPAELTADVPDYLRPLLREDPAGADADEK